jgi:ribosomal protein L22
MTADIPEGVTLETVYAVEIAYTPEAAERRPAVRHEHLTRIARLIREGRLIEAGGYLDFSSALLLVLDDVYIRSGVWVSDLRVRAYGRVVTAVNAR